MYIKYGKNSAKISTISTNLFSLSLVSFCFMYFEVVLLDAYIFSILMSIYHYEMFHFIFGNICLKSTLFLINIASQAFF